MNQHSQDRIVQLAPPVRSMSLALVQRMADEGIDVEVTQGGRSWQVQDAYFAQGRLTYEEVNLKRRLAGLSLISAAENTVRVTDAPGGYSWHNYFMAFDAAPFDANGNPDWNEAHLAWAEMEKVGAEIGLECGAGWTLKKRDAPHFQFTGRFTLTPTDEVRRIYSAGGLQAVWDAAYGRAA